MDRSGSDLEADEDEGMQLLRDRFRLSLISIAETEAKKYDMEVSAPVMGCVSDLAFKLTGNPGALCILFSSLIHYHLLFLGFFPVISTCCFSTVRIPFTAGVYVLVVSADVKWISEHFSSLLSECEQVRGVNHFCELWTIRRAKAGYHQLCKNSCPDYYVARRKKMNVLVSLIFMMLNKGGSTFTEFI